ncbi:MAG: hypothetical protein ACRC1K_05055, partial [Planctomycetia bacterium]
RLREKAREDVMQVEGQGGSNHVGALVMALNLRPDVIFYLSDVEDLSKTEVDALTARNKSLAAKKGGNRATIHVVQFHLDATRPPAATARLLASENKGTHTLIDNARLKGDRG